MKRSILTLALAAVMMMLVFAVPAMANGGDVTIAYGTPKIDAVVDDVWAKTPGYATPNSYQGAPITSDTSAEWKFLWDEEYIYVLCVIQDSQLTANSTTYWKNDDTQLFIDFLNSSDFANASYSEFGTALGIRYCWEGGVLTPPDNFVIKENSSAYQYEEGEEEYDSAAHAQATTETGYIVEYRIKPTLFCDSFKMEAGQQGGIDFVNDDAMTGSDTRNNLFMYSVHGDTWNKPTYLSTFTLAAKDAVIDLDAAAAEKAAKEAAAAEAARAAEEAARLLEEERIAQKTEGVKVVYGTPVVDGDIDDVWASVPGYKATHVYQNAEIKAPVDAEWKVMWDETRFYVLVNIKDDQLDAMNTTLWKNDNTQFFIDFGHGHDFAANEYDGDPSALGIRFTWLGGVMDLPAGFTVTPVKGTMYASDSAEYNNFVKAQKTNDEGFVIEYSFEPTLFAPDFKMEEGAKGGLDFVNDATNIGANDRLNLYYYSVDGNTWGSNANLVPFTFVKEAKAAEEAVEAPKAEEVVETPAVEEVVETPAAEEVVETPAVEKVVETPKAPQTFDFAVIAAIAAAVSCAGYAICKKH